MKTILFLPFLFFTTNIFAQTAEEPLLAVAEQMPSFPGGEVEMMKFIVSNIKYPQHEKEKGISGKCYVGFVVEKDGSISEAKILKGIPNGPGCDAEAIRVVKLMGKWIPGKQNGKEVRVQFNLPIKFTIQPRITVSEKDTVFYDSAWEVCKKTEAEYYRLVAKQEDGYLVKDIHIKNNQPQMIFECSNLDPLVMNGKCTLYYEDGHKHREGNYQKDKRIGIWTIWEKDEKDSLVVECFLDETFKNIHVPAERTTNNKLNVAYQIEVMPSFPGGEGEMMKYIQRSVQYPTVEKHKNVSGTCYVTFVVEKDGQLTDVKILRGVDKGPGCDEEAMRVVRSMPQWLPGSQFGRYVRVQFNLPIKFTLR